MDGMFFAWSMQTQRVTHLGVSNQCKCCGLLTFRSSVAVEMYLLYLYKTCFVTIQVYPSVDSIIDYGVCWKLSSNSACFTDAKVFGHKYLFYLWYLWDSRLGMSSYFCLLHYGVGRSTYCSLHFPFSSSAKGIRWMSLLSLHHEDQTETDNGAYTIAHTLIETRGKLAVKC